MVSSLKPSLSIGEKLKLFASLLFVAPPRLAYHAAKLLLFAARNGLDLQQYWICAQVKVLFSTFSGRQIQYINPTSVESYKGWVAQKAKRNKDPALQERLLCDIQPLNVGQSNILWVGNRRKASKVVLFFHGGGYILPTQPGHFEWCWNAYVVPGVESGTEVAVAVLHYTLAPGGQYPMQLRQAAAAFAEVSNAGFQPKDIIIGGDSAGGNLTAQVLHHLVHPHPEAQHITLEEPLAGAFMVSPWIGVDTSSRSFQNHYSDMLTVKIMDDLAAEGVSEEDLKKTVYQGDSWDGAVGIDAHESWLSELGRATKKLYVTVGEREILADQGIKLVEKLKKLNTGVDVRLEASAKEAHDFILLEGWVGKVGDATIRMRDWFKQFLV